MDFQDKRGPYKTNIEPILRFYAHFFGENRPDSWRQYVETEARLLTKCVADQQDQLPFTKTAPRLLGELIELVRCLPPYDSLEFKLLHPLTILIDSEPTTPIDIERGVAQSPEFAKCFNALFENSSEQIRMNTRRSGGLLALTGKTTAGPVHSCGFWGKLSLSHDREALTADYWRCVLKRDVSKIEKRDWESWDDYFDRVHQDDDYSDLTLKSIEFDRSQFDFGSGAILSEMDVNPITLTMDRVGRFGLSERLAAFLMQEPVWAAAKRMADIYEALYLLLDTAYIVEHGLTQVTLSSQRSVEDDVQLVSDGGFLRQKRSLFWTAIADEDVRTAQIRTCKILDCRKVFWARAKNQWCCSPRCSNTYHVQNYRYKTPEQRAAYVERQNNRDKKRLASFAKTKRIEVALTPLIKSPQKER